MAEFPNDPKLTDLYLIAHKVRGEPAFDIAERMPCPECAATGCDECESLGYWWIIPTSGHRAYPYMNWLVSELWLTDDYGDTTCNPYLSTMPVGLPDHYPSTTTPTFTGSLFAKLGLRKRTEPITRRV